MISRRHFLVSSGSCVFSIGMLGTGVGQETDFICATVEPETSPEDLENLELKGADGESLSFADLALELQGEGLTLYGTASVADAWRFSDGLTPNSGKITLGVRFTDGTLEQQAAVERHAKKWTDGPLGKVVEFRFGVPPRDAQIAITFATGRNLSKVGRNSASVAKTAATMELSEASERHVCHEFGHALGLKHEHSNPNNPIKWNRDRVISDMAKQGWNAATVESQIFRKFSPEFACLGDAAFNPTSVMLYPIPSAWTLDGFTVGLNSKISDRDHKCIGSLYRVKS